MKWRRWGRTLMVLFGLALLGWIAFTHPHWMLQMAQLNALPGLILLIVFLSPLGSLSLSSAPTNSQSGSRGAWFGQLLIAQISLLILFCASVIAYVNLGPQLLSPSLTLSLAVNTIQTYSFKEWGIFPWGVYGFWALLIGYVMHSKQGEPYFYQIGSKLCPKFLEPLFKNMVTFACSGANVMGISFTLGSIVLLFTYFLQKQFYRTYRQY